MSDQEQTKTAVDLQIERLAAEQEIPIDQAAQQYINSSVGTVHLDSIPKKQPHNWIDRGMFISCEGAGHPHHRHGKRLK
jgi:hypothetical protein